MNAKKFRQMLAEQTPAYDKMMLEEMRFEDQTLEFISWDEQMEIEYRKVTEVVRRISEGPAFKPSVFPKYTPPPVVDGMTWDAFTVQQPALSQNWKTFDAAEQSKIGRPCDPS